MRNFLSRAFTRMSALAGIHALDQNFKAALDVHAANPRDFAAINLAQIKLEGDIPYIFQPAGQQGALLLNEKPSPLADLERAKAFALWISQAGRLKEKSPYAYPFALYLRVISTSATLSVATGHEQTHRVLSQAYAELLPISAHPDKNKRDPMGERSIEHYMNELHDVWMTAAQYPEHKADMRMRLLRNAAKLDEWDAWPHGRPNLRSRVYDHRQELLDLIDPYQPPKP